MGCSCRSTSTYPTFVALNWIEKSMSSLSKLFRWQYNRHSKDRFERSLTMLLRHQALLIPMLAEPWKSGFCFGRIVGWSTFVVCWPRERSQARTRRAKTVHVVCLPYGTLEWNKRTDSKILSCTYDRAQIITVPADDEGSPAFVGSGWRRVYKVQLV
jgi:hypothetical protein